MPLSRKLMMMNLALIVALGVLGAALVWGLRNMREAMSGAADEYAELLLVEQAMYHCSLAKSQMADPDGGSADAVVEVETALQRVRDFQTYQHDEEVLGPEHEETEALLAARIDEQLSALLERIRPVRHGGMDIAHIQAMDMILPQLARLAEETDVVGATSMQASRTSTTLLIVGLLAALIVLGSLLASALCYVSVMKPLQRLHKGVSRVASGAFDERVEEHGSREFADLAGDFNRMAAELATLYRDLEKKVQVKSQELVRSERLASVGFLAAGVAHEINNPLNIMSGYAEMARGWLDGQPREAHLAEAREALEIIRQEAFRCKEITGKLLSLATGESERTDIDLSQLAAEVANVLRGLRKYRDRSIIVKADDNAHAPVRANAAQIKQVLLNLMVNALEAAPSVSGEVRVECRRTSAGVEVAVIDNGEGMAAEVRERVFEPFFTTRRQSAGPQRNRGVGLGLSISHAIITSHGGKIAAESEGPGRGSRFVIELPLHVVSSPRPEPMIHAATAT